MSENCFTPTGASPLDRMGTSVPKPPGL